MPDYVVSVPLTKLEYDYVCWRAKAEAKSVPDVIRDALLSLPPVVWRSTP
jgi:hypothetical protein